MTITPNPRPARLTRWLMALPHGLERLLPWANKRALFLLVLLTLVLTIPFIVTPLTVWQQFGVAAGLILFS